LKISQVLNNLALLKSKQARFSEFLHEGLFHWKARYNTKFSDLLALGKYVDITIPW
jgi:hypothetical protein